MSDGMLDAAFDWLGENVGDAVEYIYGGDDDDDVEIIDAGSFDPFGDGSGFGASGGIGGLPALPSDGYGLQYAPGSMSAAQSLVSAVLASPLAQQLLQRAVGVVFGPAPSWSGQGITGPIVKQLFAQLTKDQRAALSQRLAGMDAPIGLSKAAGQDFLLLWLYDGFRALGVEDIDDLANN